MISRIRWWIYLNVTHRYVKARVTPETIEKLYNTRFYM